MYSCYAHIIYVCELLKTLAVKIVELRQLIVGATQPFENWDNYQKNMQGGNCKLLFFQIWFICSEFLNIKEK